MEIKGKVYCFFEQSGTFKNEFIKLGIPAEDYDIQNNFGQTDHVIDLFHEIETAYEGGVSIFDSVTYDDLIVAFFPCTYFSALSQVNISWGCKNYINMDTKEKCEQILHRSSNRERNFTLLTKLFAIVEMKGLRLIVENPWALQHFLKGNFIVPPTFVDNDRSLRGDHFHKPTAYWFWGCEPTHGRSFQPRKVERNINQVAPNRMPGICNAERSMIHPDYARNFICDFILGKVQKHTMRELFN
jgi:predicted nucleic acid-binding Zn ribbon protein